jgi:hypothetical protein
MGIFADMVARGCERNVITYSSLIRWGVVGEGFAAVWGGVGGFGGRWLPRVKLPCLESTRNTRPLPSWRYSTRRPPPLPPPARTAAPRRRPAALTWRSSCSTACSRRGAAPTWSPTTRSSRPAGTVRRLLGGCGRPRPRIRHGLGGRAASGVRAG